MVERDKHLHLLKGIVHCSHCRRTLIPHDSGKKDPAGRPYPILRLRTGGAEDA
jgi:hypothetical protein